MDRARVLGVAIDRLTLEQTVERCLSLVANGAPARQVSVNAAKLVAMRDDPALARAVESAAVVSADGQSIVWASRLLGDPLPERVPGIDLMSRLCELSAQRGYRIAILGAREAVLAAAVAKLVERYPGLQVAIAQHGYFDDAESPSVAAAIAAARPHILFVAMSSPRKELWQEQHAAAIGIPLAVGVGGAIDVVAGVVARAPRAWQALGLEWLFRALQEPRRLGGRYVRTNTTFAFLLAGAILRRLVDRPGAR